MIDIRPPEITVQLTGKDGNAFMIIGLVQRALRDAGVSRLWSLAVGLRRLRRRGCWVD